MKTKDEKLSREGAEQNDQSTKGHKKRLLIVIGVILLVMMLLFAASYAIDAYYKARSKNEKPIDFDFYPADYGENIFDDEEYNTLIKDGFISYTDSSSGVTVGIDTDNPQKYGADVKFLVDYINTIVNGDCDAYNNMFSEDYLKYNGKHEKFTMQKLYDVSITKLTVSNAAGKNGTYEIYEFILEYKILKNNGTFRKDIGDGSKKQYLTVTTESGGFLISSISTASYASK